jgi:hypothetical protein
MTVHWWIADISEAVDAYLSEIFEHVYYSLTIYESTDITSAVHMFTFACGITSDFEVYVELVDLQTVGPDFIQA